ncbi:PREDICTED: uncharacterized protein LOC106315406 [Brassica oleracea var. oleracea]|uniref:Uncharacterized protein n=1 Tax=Brassica oleracea var. oleracea TaxID=109376 RepID=A0A0D3EEL2_BRAOL|nr:PREDICTED: uncharacterized protein LOC106315406 [Brassica oleracea var. oleracea]XP_013608585.1 PREDICTED: uncharacterized protein LOC106315406 [Brassica oleracea var. oleracea]
MRVHTRRLFVIMIRTSYRWISSHPHLLGCVGVVYLLYRACPLLFSPLLAASPVLVCTFVLLGAILSFGETNIIPEIETEPETTVHEAALFTTEASRDPTVVERGDESFKVERFVSTEKDVADRLVENQLSEVEDGDGQPFDYRPLVDQILDEAKRDTHVRFEEREEEKFDGKRDEQWRNVGGSLDEMMDDSKEDQVDLTPWRPMRHEEGEDDDVNDSLHSSSDDAESSSPDPSMTDSIPMLDELHPLLHSENPGRGIEGSDATSEEPDMSSSDSDEGMESDVNSESHGEEDDNKKEEEEEEKKEDESKSPIKWTEADQKNVMDLGSLELERNQRLESLIARRRARNNMRMVAERNLIDFDCADVPFNMPPISTARHNPFDLSYDDMGLPPIPGSAPSIMFARRRNPFDLPYEPNEEKPDLKGDGFEEEFSSPQPKEPVFRRYESFSVGPSMLGGPRHDRLRPFFALERLANEGRSYYPFERQLSEVSESKVSSVPDTESVCTILEDDEKKVDEDDADRETDVAKTDMASDHDEEKILSASDHDEEKGHLSEDSDFDEQADSKTLHHDVAEIILGSAETHITHHDQSNIMDGKTSDKTNHDEEDSSDSESSVSEIAHINEDEAMLVSEREVDLHETSGTSFGGSDIHVARGVEDDYHHDGAPAFITTLPSLEESTIHNLCGLVGDHHETPVYDSSPPSASRFPSFSSVSSDYKPDLPGKSGEEVQENTDNEREVYSESLGPDETETSTGEVVYSSTHVTGEASLGIDGQKNSTVSVSEFEEALVDPSSLPLDKNEDADHQEDVPLSISSQEDLEELHEEVKEAVDTRELDVSESLVDLVSPTEEEVVSTGTVEHTSSPLGCGDTTEHLTTLEESPDMVHDIAETSVNRSVAEGIVQEEENKQKDEASHQIVNADIPIDSYATLSSGAVEYVETHSFNDGDAPQAEQDPVQSSVSDAKEEIHPNQTMDIEVDSVNARAQNVGSEEATPAESDREPTWSDKSVVEQSSLEPCEDQVPARAAPVSMDTAELSCLTSDTSSSPAESPEYETPMVGESSKAEYFQETVNEGLDHVVERSDQLTDLQEISQSPPEAITEEAERFDQFTYLHTISQSPPEVITEEAEKSNQFIDSLAVSQSPPEVITEEAERLDQLTDLHEGSQSSPEVITEEADEIKETDEGLLSKLDTVGDFGVKEVSEPGPSSVGSETAPEQTEPRSVLETRSVQDIESAFQQIHEGSEVEDVILPNTVQDQLAQENSEHSTETKSVLTVVEATSKDDLDTAMNQAVVESMCKQPMSPESDGGSGETKHAVEIEPSGSLVEERSLDETNVHLNNTPEKEEDEESRPKERTTSDVSTTETRSLEETSESIEEMSTEVISERVVIPTEATESSNVTLSDEVVTEEAKAETSSNLDGTVQSPESKEAPEDSEESISEVKTEKKDKGRSDSSGSSSSSSSSDSD